MADNAWKQKVLDIFLECGILTSKSRTGQIVIHVKGSKLIKIDQHWIGIKN